MNITEDYCSFEVAKLLKEKGFDEPCDNYYNKKGSEKQEPQELTWDEIMYSYDEFLKAPTHQMAMKWLREVHNYHIEIERNFEYFHNGIMHKPSYDAVVQDIANKDKNYFVAECNTYEEAVEAVLKYSLENLI